MIGAIIHVAIPDNANSKPVWCLYISKFRVAALENHYFDNQFCRVGVEWHVMAGVSPHPDPPDHIIAAAMRLVLERKIPCAD